MPIGRHHGDERLARKLAKAKHLGDVAAFLDVGTRAAIRVPMMAWSAACGFPSPAEDYVDRPLDFNELLIEHPAATVRQVVHCLTCDILPTSDLPEASPFAPCPIAFDISTAA